MESSVHVGNGGTSFSGPDAVNLFRAITLKSALGLAKVGIQCTRGVSKARTLKLATEYTGKRYKRGAYDEAIADMTQWIETMKAAMPITRS